MIKRVLTPWLHSHPFFSEEILKTLLFQLHVRASIEAHITLLRSTIFYRSSSSTLRVGCVYSRQMPPQKSLPRNRRKATFPNDYPSWEPDELLQHRHHNAESSLLERNLCLWHLLHVRSPFFGPNRNWGDVWWPTTRTYDQRRKIPETDIGATPLCIVQTIEKSGQESEVTFLTSYPKIWGRRFFWVATDDFPADENHSHRWRELRSILEAFNVHVYFV